MSDPKSSYGEPIDDPEDVDQDVVVRAHEGLADAEAAQREAVPPAPSDTTTEAGRDTDATGAPIVAERVEEPRTLDEPRSSHEPETVVAEAVVVEENSDEVPWYERDDIPMDDDPVVTPGAPAPAREESYASAPAEPAAAPVAPVVPAAQPIFVQAPEAPRPRGNRGAAGLIGLLAAVVFAILYLAAWLGLELLYGGITFADVPQAALDALATWALWVPVVAFFLGFWLLGAFINRGRWGHWVVWGLLVGLAAYGGHLLGQLFQAPFWMLTAREGSTLLEEQVLAPLAIVAFVLGRELTIWFGAWVAARGRRATELNEAAQREYERTLEAGPQLHHV
jgi:hypothetical protein